MYQSFRGIKDTCPPKPKALLPQTINYGRGVEASYKADSTNSAYKKLRMRNTYIQLPKHAVYVLHSSLQFIQETDSISVFNIRQIQGNMKFPTSFILSIFLFFPWRLSQSVTPSPRTFLQKKTSTLIPAISSSAGAFPARPPMYAPTFRQWISYFQRHRLLLHQGGK